MRERHEHGNHRSAAETTAARAARTVALAAVGIDASEPHRYGRAPAKARPIGRPASKAPRTVAEQDAVTYGDATPVRRIGDRYRPVDAIDGRYSATADRLPPHRDDTDPRAMREAAKRWRRTTFVAKDGKRYPTAAEPTAKELASMGDSLYASLWSVAYRKAYDVGRRMVGSMKGDRSHLAADAPFERARADSTMHVARTDTRAIDLATDTVGEIWYRVSSGKDVSRAHALARAIARNLAVTHYRRLRIAGGLEQPEAVADTATTDKVTAGILATMRGEADRAAARLYVGAHTVRMTAEGIRTARHRARARLADALLRAGIESDEAEAPALAGFWSIDSTGAPTFASYGGEGDEVAIDPASRVACALAVLPV